MEKKRIPVSLSQLRELVLKRSRNLGETVEASNSRIREESSQDVSDHTSNTMSGEDIEGIIVLEDDLELGGQVTASSCDDSNSERSRSTDVSRGRGDSYETRDDSGTETDGRPFSLETPIHEHPGETTDGGSDDGNNDSLSSTHVLQNLRKKALGDLQLTQNDLNKLKTLTLANAEPPLKPNQPNLMHKRLPQHLWPTGIPLKFFPLKKSDRDSP